MMHKEFLILRPHFATDRLIRLLILMVLASLSEGVGLMLLVPLLEVLQPGPVGASAHVGQVLQFWLSLGLPRNPASLLLGFVLLIALRGAIQVWRDQLSQAQLGRAVDGLRRDCFAALLRAEWRWLATGRSSDQANLLLTDVNRVGTGLNFALLMLTSLVSLVVLLALAFLISWRLSLLASLLVGLIWLLMKGVRRKAMLLGQGLGEANRAIQSSVQESLAGIRLAKIYGSEAHFLHAFQRVVDKLRTEQEAFQSSSSLLRGLQQLLWAALIALYLYLGLAVLAQPVSELLAMVVLLSRLAPLMGALQQSLYHVLHALPALQEVEALLAAGKRSAEPEQPGQLERIEVRDAIELRDLSVCYPGREQPALHKLSLRLPARTTTAVIGHSGAGKSTLADVLTGLLQADQGGLYVDGKAVAGPLRLAWRHGVAYVPQQDFLFHDSIRANLLWASPDASDRDLHEALGKAAAEFVFALPHGLDTQIGDGGVRLSGGERQRIGLARALLHKPSLLILDEATSALDVDNELRIRDAIQNLHGDLTVLIIGHRLATLEHADQVLVLKDGQALACGSWSAVQPFLSL